MHRVTLLNDTPCTKKTKPIAQISIVGPSGHFGYPYAQIYQLIIEDFVVEIHHGWYTCWNSLFLQFLVQTWFQSVVCSWNFQNFEFFLWFLIHNLIRQFCHKFLSHNYQWQDCVIRYFQLTTTCNNMIMSLFSIINKILSLFSINSMIVSLMFQLLLSKTWKVTVICYRKIINLKSSNKSKSKIVEINNFWLESPFI